MRSKAVLKSTTLIMLACSALLASPSADAEPQYEIYLTAQEVEGVPLNAPADEFACTDRIYAVVEIDDPELRGVLADDEQLLEATWRDPNGKDREHTEYPIRLFDGRGRYWLWLKLHRSSDAALVQFMNPSAGMDEFIGGWEVHLRIDGRLIRKQAFSVLC